MNNDTRLELISLLDKCLEAAKRFIRESDYGNLNGLLISLALRNGFVKDRDSAEMLFPIMLVKAVLEVEETN